MKVQILKNDNRIGIKKGEIYEAIRYWLAPMEKVTLLKRIPDGHNPNCTEYFHNVKILQSNPPRA